MKCGYAGGPCWPAWCSRWLVSSTAPTRPGVILLPGLLFLVSAPFIPASPKADRVRHAKLTHELAGYSTPAQRRDLEATLARYPDDVTDEMRDILAGQTVAGGAIRIPGA